MLMTSDSSLFSGVMLLALFLKIYYQTQGHIDFLLSSRSFMVLQFTFWLIIHFNYVLRYKVPE